MSNENINIESDIRADDLLKFVKLYHRDEMFRKSFDEISDKTLEAGRE